MKLLAKFFELLDFTDITITRREKKSKKKPPTIFSELRESPENFKLEAYIENDELIVKVKRKDIDYLP